MREDNTILTCEIATETFEVSLITAFRRSSVEGYMKSIVYSLMRVVGIEPTRLYNQRILSPLRLPVPPYPLNVWRLQVYHYHMKGKEG